MMREWLLRVLSVNRRGRRDAELDDELRFHVDEIARRFEREGLDPSEARTAAEREFGGVERTKQAWRDQRTWLPLEEVLQDIRYGVRVLRRSKGLTVIAALMLATAVAASTSLFAVVDAVLLAPLPYAHAGQLVVLFESYVTQHAPTVSVTPGNFLEWQARARTIAAMTTIDQRQQNLTSDGDPVQVNVGAVSRGFAATVGVQPVAGRMFAEAEFEPGRERVAILSHALWTTRFGRGAVEGRSIVLDDQPYTVVGVMPAGFMFPTPQQQLWVPMPLTAADRENRTGHTLYAVARVRDGISIGAARRELDDVAAQLQREFPASNGEWGITLTPARAALVGDTGTVLAAMMGAVALLLLVACANVAGLLLTHGVARRRELAVRTALGASRLRLVRQLLTESVLLALAGTVLGVAAAWIAQPLLEALRPDGFLTWKPVAIDARAMMFSAIVAVACGIVFGTAPSLTASRANIAAAASERAAGRRSSRVRQALVAVEVALALVLVAGASLLAQALTHVTRVDVGFQPDRVVSMTVSLPAARYGDDRRVDTFYRSLFERIRAIPGVRAAGAVHALPLSGNTSVRPFHVQGKPIANPPDVAHYRIVTPGYLEAMSIPLRAGRIFTERDTATAPLAVIVNETLSRHVWGDSTHAIGSRISFGGGLPPNVTYAEVVGVVGDVRHFGPATPPEAEMYWLAEQIDALPGPQTTLRRMRRGLTLAVSTESTDPLSVVGAVREAVRGVDPSQPIANVRTLTSLMTQALWLSRAATWLLTIFGGAALAFALLGVFGAASYAVAQRRRELAVRLALGAEPQAVARLVLTGALAGAAAGIAAGIVLAIALGRSVSTLLVDIAPTDPTTLVGVAATLALATVVATWIPARRAAKIDPMRVLRTE
jgi:putative ABC transport system permease protein